MPKKKRKAASSDHLATALESLRERPSPEFGLESDGKILPLGYIATVGKEPGGNPSCTRERSGKLRMAFNLPADLCERARNAVWHLADRIQINLSSLTQRTLEREIARLEKRYNDGKPFPQRKGRLKGGRPSESKRRENGAEKSSRKP